MKKWKRRHQKGDEGKKGSVPSDASYSHPRGGFGMIALAWLLKGLLLMGLFYVIASNIEPYSVWAMQYLDKAVNGWVSRLPGIGALLDMTAKFAGLIIWGIVQIGEVLPSMLLGSAFGLEILISAFSQQQAEGPAKMSVSASDDELMKFLKRKFNGLNMAPINFWRRIQPIAYIVDLIILWQVFPPLKDGYSFQEILFTANMGGVAWGNVVQMIITMFAFEAVVWGWIRLDETIYLIRRGLKPWSN
jgi:hypothetical protein